MIASGIIPPVLTLLDERHDVDVEAMKLLVDKLICGGVHALFVAGTAGFASIITQKPYERLIETVLSHVCGRTSILAGVLEPSTARSIERLKILEDKGIKTAVVVAPYYLRASNDRQLLRHFEKIRGSTSLELVLYNIPVCTGTSIPVALACDMKRRGWITACKDSSGDGKFFADLCEQGRECGLKVYQGMRPDFAVMERLGASGCVPVPANVFPEMFVDAWNKRKNGKELPAAQKKCDEAWSQLVVGGDFFGNSTKALKHIGIGSGIMPEPFD